MSGLWGHLQGPLKSTLIRKCLCLLGLEQGHQAVSCSTVSLSLVSTLKLSPTPQETLASQLAKSNSQPINLFRFLAPGDLEDTPPPPHCLCREADWTAQLRWVSTVTASGLEPGIPGRSGV